MSLSIPRMKCIDTASKVKTRQSIYVDNIVKHTLLGYIQVICFKLDVLVLTTKRAPVYLLVYGQTVSIYPFGDSVSHSDFWSKLTSVIRQCYFVMIQNMCLVCSDRTIVLGVQRKLCYITKMPFLKTKKKELNMTVIPGKPQCD